MTDLEAVAARISRRNYSGPLDDAQKNQLENWLAAVNLEHGLHCSLLENAGKAFGGISKSYGMFTGVNALVLLAGRANDPNLHEQVGHAGEWLVLQATKLGLGSCWVGGTYDRATVAKSLPENQELVAVLTVGPVKENQGVLERAVRRVATRKGKRPEELYTVRQGNVPEWFMQGVQAASHAPSALNRQPVQFYWDTAGASAKVPSSEGFNLVDLGIAKLHFEIGAEGRFEPGNGGLFIKE